MTEEKERGTTTDKGTLLLFGCAIFVNTDMSLFLEAQIEDKKWMQNRLRETHDEFSESVYQVNAHKSLLFLLF